MDGHSRPCETAVSLRIQGPEEARVTAQILEVLAALFAREIPRDRIELLASEAMAALFLPAGSTLPRLLRERLELTGAEALEEELSQAYAQTFLGPGPHVGPHESLHRRDAPHRTHWGESTAEVNRFLREHGLCLDEGFSGFPDHIAVELGVIARLLMFSATAEDERHSQRAFVLAHQFIDDHLSRWSPEFQKTMERHAADDFYRDLGRVTAQVATEFLGITCRRE